MAVAFDASSKSSAINTASQSEASFSWLHTPVGIPSGVLIFVLANHQTNGSISGVTYGGIALTAVPSGLASDTLGEPGRVQTWFLGSNIPTGAQTVQVTRGNDITSVWAVCITVTTATGESAVTGVQTVSENAILIEASIDDSSPGTNSMRFAGAHSGQAVMDVGANSTLLQQLSSAGGGSVTWTIVRETISGQGSRPVGFNGVSDDAAAVYLAVIESGVVVGDGAKLLSGAPGRIIGG
jgi:hypothetical protein